MTPKVKSFVIKLSSLNYKNLAKLKIVPSEPFNDVISRLLLICAENKVKWEVRRTHGIAKPELGTTVTPKAGAVYPGTAVAPNMVR